MPTTFSRRGNDKRKNGRNQGCRVRLTGYPCRTRYFFTRREALTWGIQLEDAYLSGVDPALADPLDYPPEIIQPVTNETPDRSIYAALLIYADIKRVTLSEKSWEDKEKPIIERWKKHFFAKHDIGELYKDQIEIWISHCQGEGMPADTIRARLAILARAIDAGLDRWHLNLRNPARGHRIQDDGSGRRRPTAAEKQKLYDGAIASKGVMLYWAMRWAEECGMRAGEIARMRAADIDFTQNPPVLTVPVSKNGARAYYMWAQLIALYEEIRSVFGSGPYLFGGIDSHSISQAFGRVRDRIGISKDVSFHSLRYEATSWMTEAGVDRKLRKIIIGHTTDRMSSHYTQFSEVAGELMTTAAASRVQPHTTTSDRIKRRVYKAPNHKMS